MTLEEALAALEEQKKTNEEQKAANDKMSSKLDELLGEVKGERQKRREAQEAADQAAEEARAKAEEAAEKSGDIESLRKQLEVKHAKTLEEANKRAEEAESQLNKLVIDGGIDAALDAAGMAPAYKRMLRRDFAAEHEITIKDGQAFVGDDALADAVKKWTEAPEVSGLKAAGQSNGSGASGGGKSAGGTLADLDGAARLKLARENPTRMRELIAAAAK